ncbi:acylphosphatase [Candidatus Woesearchaeota archaeon]|nr:acylphosphatase [Candidatus Woesearchaeota archaeon]
MNKRVKVYIIGAVQGVFFRANIKQLADKLNLKGYAKNLPDGSIEAVFEGDEKKILEIINFCKKGPKHAKVNNIKVINEEFKCEYTQFEISYD